MSSGMYTNPVFEQPLWAVARCPRCGHQDGIFQEYEVGVGGIEQGEPSGYGCANEECDFEAPTDEPFRKAYQDAELEREKALRDPPEAEARELAERFIGKTIASVEFDLPDPPPGFGGAPDIEGATIHFTDGSTAELHASGWHDIQSLGVSLSDPV